MAKDESVYTQMIKIWVSCVRGYACGYIWTNGIRRTHNIGGD